MGQHLFENYYLQKTALHNYPLYLLSSLLLHPSYDLHLFLPSHPLQCCPLQHQDQWENPAISMGHQQISVNPIPVSHYPLLNLWAKIFYIKVEFEQSWNFYINQATTMATLSVFFPYHYHHFHNFYCSQFHLVFVSVVLIFIH